jgi:hypothetical protein
LCCSRLFLVVISEPSLGGFLGVFWDLPLGD